MRMRALQISLQVSMRKSPGTKLGVAQLWVGWQIDMRLLCSCLMTRQNYNETSTSR